ncbi:acetyltransferase [Halobacillus andaensis]|uniref:Acetyltransferase n=1 Tax=Halobacillus andaensis TaxID=1176239 RepID=A0A917EYE8_HALAA|nr:GNAT family N-acetyltransferase [Halobacillus andaensis]MBP2004340.1 ribosomal protein S18 acetylase RimI-like enzyme [Halobacillus andaensis]GGF22414.1 acetyltransferase [Halobacillus andaensis]
MIVKPREYAIHNLQYLIRSAECKDAKALSEVRLQIDGETEYMDRVQGEAYIDEEGFQKIIKKDSDSLTNIFLVAEVKGAIAGFSRCEGNELKRSSHKVEFGVGVLMAYWGYGIGKNLLKESISWADSNHIRKMTLSVLETNEKAISMYKSCGFKVEGILQNDKWLSDGEYYNTLLMGSLR